MKSLDEYLRDVIAREGSDLHLADGLPPKARIHGALEPIEDGELKIAALVEPIFEARHEKAFQDYETLPGTRNERIDPENVLDMK